jgi:hypothetical protein
MKPLSGAGVLFDFCQADPRAACISLTYEETKRETSLVQHSDRLLLSRLIPRLDL